MPDYLVLALTAHCLRYIQGVLEEITEINLVVNLKLREDVLIAKCLGRRICSDCGGNFNLAKIDVEGTNGEPRILMPPLLPPPACSDKMTLRVDDTDEVVRTRLRVYHDEVSFRVVNCLVILVSCTVDERG